MMRMMHHLQREREREREVIRESYVYPLIGRFKAPARGQGLPRALSNLVIISLYYSDRASARARARKKPPAWWLRPVNSANKDAE